MSTDEYQGLLRDLVFELLEKTKDASLYEKDDAFNSGYRAALYAVILRIENKVELFGIEKDAVALAGFSADEWQREGLSYWKRK